MRFGHISRSLLKFQGKYSATSHPLAESWPNLAEYSPVAVRKTEALEAPVRSSMRWMMNCVNRGVPRVREYGISDSMFADDAGAVAVTFQAKSSDGDMGRRASHVRS